MVDDLTLPELELVGEFEAASDDTLNFILRTIGTQSRQAVIDLITPALAANPDVTQAGAVAAATAVADALFKSDVITGPDRRIPQILRAAGWVHGIVDPDTLAVLQGIDEGGKTKLWLREDSLTDYGTIGDRMARVVRNDEWLWAIADPATQAVFLGVRRTGHVYAFGLDGSTAQSGAVVPAERGSVAVGDSLTYSDGTNFPETVEPGLTNQPGARLAMFGQSSQHQALLLGTLDAQLTFASNQLPANGPAAVTLMGPTNRDWSSSSGGADWIFPGTIVTADHTVVRGQLAIKQNGAGIEFRYPPLTAAKTVRAGVAFVSDYRDVMTRRTHDIWLGRNNASRGYMDYLHADIDSIIARIESTEKRFIVYGITGRTDEGLSATGTAAISRARWVAGNASSLAKWGSVAAGGNYFDMHGWMRDSLLGVLGITPTSTDLADIADDRIPSRFYIDTTHFTPEAYTAIGQKRAQLKIAKGWT
ncbi:hypothetical protein AB0230_07140 [Microbacterium sp. NPDC089190]|uniref:hypothetical protein n=1 Tax=Microbacterium sp. NPDC089190 TaxID=3155063 RepID=UPI0034509881